MCNRRSAELVRAALPITCCGERGRIFRWRRLAKRRVRWPVVIVVDPKLDILSRVAEPEEQRLVEHRVPIHISPNALSV